jgi:hypothetical protein
LSFSEDTEYVIGVDLGQSRDPTAIAIVRRVSAFGGEVHDPLLEDATELYQCGHLERLPLNTSYPTIVAHVAGLLERLPRGTELVIDFTGVGRPVFDMFEIAGIDPMGVLITGGTTESGDGRIYTVPKINLVSGVQALLHEERLKIHRELPEAPVLVSELQNFRVDFTTAGHMTFNARSGTHDDLVLALAIAVWRAKRAGGPALLTFYRAQAERAKWQDADPRAQAGEDLPWRRTRADIQREADELTTVYLDTLAGIIPGAGLCATCGKPLGVTKVSDGVNRWHPDCPPPRC